MHAINETVTNLHKGVRVPTLGYRVIPGHANTVNNVLTALSAGIRHFDISSHPDVEKAFAKAASKTNVPREELFLTVRIANEDHGYERAIHAFRNSLTRLQTDYADLLMIDWPNPKMYRDNYEQMAIETWKALETAYKSGAARAIGVANYEARHIEFCLEHSEIAPMVNEARIYPGFPFTDNLYCANEHRIQTEGFLPENYQAVLQSRELGIFAEKYKVTPLQIFVRYLFEKGCIALLYGEDQKELESCFNAYNFQLNPDDVKYMDVMKNYGPENINPDEADF